MTFFNFDILPGWLFYQEVHLDWNEWIDGVLRVRNSEIIQKLSVMSPLKWQETNRQPCLPVWTKICWLYSRIKAAGKTLSTLSKCSLARLLSLSVLTDILMRMGMIGVHFKQIRLVNKENGRKFTFVHKKQKVFHTILREQHIIPGGCRCHSNIYNKWIYTHLLQFVHIDRGTL